MLVWMLAHIVGVGPGLSYYINFGDQPVTVRAVWLFYVMLVFGLLLLGAVRSQGQWRLALVCSVPVGLVVSIPFITWRQFLLSFQLWQGLGAPEAMRRLLSAPGSDWSFAEAWMSFAAVLVYGVPLTFLLTALARRMRSWQKVVVRAALAFALAATSEFVLLGLSTVVAGCAIRPDLRHRFLWGWDTYVFCWQSGLAALFFLCLAAQRYRHALRRH
jgi:hypothetical protein